MSNWIDVAKASDFEDNQKLIFDHEDLHIIVVKLDGEFYAVDGMCTHADFELDDGDIVNNTIACPLHGAHFCLKTGKVMTAPAYESLETYPVRVAAGVVQVEV